MSDLGVSATKIINVITERETDVEKLILFVHVKVKRI